MKSTARHPRHLQEARLTRFGLVENFKQDPGFDSDLRKESQFSDKTKNPERADGDPAAREKETKADEKSESPAARKKEMEKMLEEKLRPRAAEIRKVNVDVARAQREAEANAKNTDYVVEGVMGAIPGGVLAPQENTRVLNRAQSPDTQVVTSKDSAGTTAVQAKNAGSATRSANAERPVDTAGQTGRRTDGAA